MNEPDVEYSGQFSEKISTSSHNTSRPGSSEIRVLHVDDNPDILELSRIYLKKVADISVLTVEDPLMAAEMKLDGFDAIVSDYEMPTLDGLGLLARLREKNTHIPFILLTGRGNDTLILNSLAQGAASFLQKTANPRAMFTELAAVIKKEVKLKRLTCQELAYGDSYLQSNLFNSLPEPAFAINSKGCVIAWNTSLEDMTGVDARSMMGGDWHRYSVVFGGFPRKMAIDSLLRSDPSALAGYELSLCTDSLITGKRTLILPDGTTRIYWEKVTRIIGSSGSTDGAIAIIRDLTQRSSHITHNKLMREQLAAIAQSMFSFGNDFTQNIRTMLTLTCKYCGAEAAGYIPGDIDHPMVYSLPSDVSASDQEILLQRIRISEKGEHNDSSHYYTRHYPLPSSGKIVLLFGIEGESSFCSTFINLLLGVVGAEERRYFARQEVVRSQERYRMLFDNAPVAIFEQDYSRVYQQLATLSPMVSSDGDTITINTDIIRSVRQNVKGVGMNEASVMFLGGKSPFEQGMNDFPPFPDFSDSLMARICSCISTGKPGFSTVENILLPDGQGRDVLMNWSAIDMVDQYRSVLVSMVDITSQKRGEQALLKANKKLNTLTMITRHDILNLMTALIGYLDLVQSEEKDIALLAHLKTCHEMCERITDIINFTRDYEQIGQCEPRWVLLTSLIRCDTLEKGFPSINIICHLPNITILTDALFPMAIYNLIENAVRHGGRNITVHISGNPDPDGSFHLIIADNGHGIAQAEKEEVFRRGYGKNSGLGLFLVREILDITGISIHECGVPGQGAKFVLRIPAKSIRG